LLFIFLIFFLIFFFFFFFLNLHTQAWNPEFSASFSNLYLLMPLSGYHFYTKKWVFFWTWTWYFIILLSLIWATYWIPQVKGDWIKPHVYYWEWWNNVILFFIPPKYKIFDSKIKYKLLMIIFWIKFSVFVYLDFVAWHQMSFYSEIIHNKTNVGVTIIVYFVICKILVEFFNYFNNLYLFYHDLIFGFENLSQFHKITMNAYILFDFHEFIELIKKLYLNFINLFTVLFTKLIQTDNILLIYLNLYSFLKLYFTLENFFIINMSFGLIILVSTLLSLIYIYSFVYILIAVSPVILLLNLIFIMFNCVLLLFWFKIEFFSILILIIYIGAISILFLFVIMLLNLQNEFYFSNKLNYILSFNLIYWIFNFNTWQIQLTRPNYNLLNLFIEHNNLMPTRWVGNFFDVYYIGTILFSNMHGLLLVLLSLILLTIMIGTISILFNKNKTL